MVDMAGDMEKESVLRLAESLVPFHLSWIENPMRIDELDSYTWVAARSPVPIAMGEHEYTTAGFEEIIQRKAVHVIQPDATWCGGMTVVKRVFRMAADAGIRTCLHRGAEVWGLHAIAALDPDPLAESGRPWIRWIDGQPVEEGGLVRPAEGPGFGVTYSPQTGTESNTD
jgi:L-alanine-DL-glutamate epimerase-like enolase superfamily enzyme